MSDKVDDAIDAVVAHFEAVRERAGVVIPPRALSHGTRIYVSGSATAQAVTDAAEVRLRQKASSYAWRNQYASATSWKMDAIRGVFGHSLSAAYYADYLKLQKLCQGKPRRDHRRYGYGLLRRTITLLLAADRKDRHWFNVATDVLWLLGDRSKRGRKLAVKAKATGLLADLKECLAQNRPPPRPPNMMLMDMASFENIQSAMNGDFVHVNLPEGSAMADVLMEKP